MIIITFHVNHGVLLRRLDEWIILLFYFAHWIFHVSILKGVSSRYRAC